MLADSFGHAGYSWKGGLAENYQDSSRVWLYDRGLLGVGHLPAIASFRDVDDPSRAPGRAAQAAISILDVIARSTGDNTLIGKKYFLSREHLRGWLVGTFASKHGKAKVRAASWSRQLELMGIPAVPFQDVPEHGMLAEFESALQDARRVIYSLGREYSWVPTE
jgi:hypothetical protein